MNPVLLRYSLFAVMLAPAAAFVWNAALLRRLPARFAATGPLVGSLLSGASAFILLNAAANGGKPAFAFRWLAIGASEVRFGFRADAMSALMLCLVAVVSLCVIVFSIGYMRGEKRLAWYFGVISLFTAAMNGLVLATDLIELYLFWELVGLCSYLLIGFWYEKPSAAAAAKKAFLTTRIGDAGLLLGIGLLLAKCGSTVIAGTAQAIELGRLSSGALTLASLLVFAGAVGKSAQFPLHVWLPDAMEGPTPVSALIHAATMVAAGVYLVARLDFMFAASPAARLTVLVIGLLTAFLAASIALVMRDIKKVLAYSTISQLGLMFVALGAGAGTAALFHLTTHAFFKALLFLGAGSVILATHHEQDIFRMGGLHKRMPLTFWAFLLGAASLAAVPPFSGFWSKDAILASLDRAGMPWAILIVLIISSMTAFYTARLVILVFLGEPATKGASTAVESPIIMSGPLVLLAVPAAAIGLLGTPFADLFGSFLGGEPEKASYLLPLLSLLAVLAGAAWAWSVYARRSPAPDMLSRALPVPHRALRASLYIDEIYAATLGRFVGLLSEGAALSDRKLIDGLIDETAGSASAAGRHLSRAQTGRASDYVFWFVLGLGVLALVFQAAVSVR